MILECRNKMRKKNLPILLLSRIEMKLVQFPLTCFASFQDHVCGSANCALALYWSKRLGKCDLVAYAVFLPIFSACKLIVVVVVFIILIDIVDSVQASARSAVVNIHLDEQNQRVLLRGKAVTIMEGSLSV